MEFNPKKELDLLKAPSSRSAGFQKMRAPQNFQVVIAIELLKQLW